MSFFFGTAEGIRTPDLLVRSQTLYPTELSAHASFETVVILALFAVVVNIFINLFFTLCKAKASARAAGCVFFLLHNKFPPILFVFQSFNTKAGIYFLRSSFAEINIPIPCKI